MDVLLAPVIDLVKYYVQTYYITYEDNRLNSLLFAVISTFLALLTKVVILMCDRIGRIDNLYAYILWVYKYKIMKEEIVIFPLSNVIPYFPINDVKMDDKPIYKIGGNNFKIFKTIIKISVIIVTKH